jgi:protoporphyrin/coproporphyrin ferrochelatase
MKTAIVLFNLGGPDRLDAVAPFLFNLFYDPAIIGLPSVLRWPLARWIAAGRAPVARGIYERIGGGSPLLRNTEAQADALEAAVAATEPGGEVKCFIVMRYWHPRAAAQAAAVQAWDPDRILLVPLYPQFSSTTTASSVREWRREAVRIGLTQRESVLCCYPDEPGLVAALAQRLGDGLTQVDASFGLPRVLFSAHGIPQKLIDAGDPYQWQVERSVAAVMAVLRQPVRDHMISYQSRVGSLKWLEPSTEAEIRRAGAEGIPLVIVPIAFVSEHSETLVELDIEYRHVAESAGVPAYIRVPTVDTLPSFIGGLAAAIRTVLQHGSGLCSATGGRVCPGGSRLCAFQQ